MPTGVDEIQTAVDPMIFNIPTIQPGLVTKKFVVLLVDIINDGLPATGERGEEKEGGRDTK